MEPECSARVHKSLPLFPILGQMDSVHNFLTYFSHPF
jgi:hypothetical protein